MTPRPNRSHLLARTRYATRNLLGSHRALYPLLRLRRSRARDLVGPATDVCVEGFPRSANTLALFPILVHNSGVNVAHHVHVPMQVRRAVELGVPCAVLIREPLEAATSLVVMSGGRIPDEAALHSWLNFYGRTLDLRPSVVAVRFEEVVADPTVVIARLNERFGTRLAGAELDAAEKADLTRRVEAYNRRVDFDERQLTVPSAAKERLKRPVRARLGESSLLEEARRLHASWTAA